MCFGLVLSETVLAKSTDKVLDSQDKVIFRQGLKLTKDILAAWQRRGSGPFYVRVNQAAAATKSSAAPNTGSGAAPINDRLSEWFAGTVIELNCLVEKVQRDQLPTLGTLEERLESLLLMVRADPAAVTAFVLEHEQSNQRNDDLAKRCTYLATLVGVLAQAYGLEDEDCLRTCLAGLLHDLALFPGILDKIQDSFDTEEERDSVLLRHGFFSSDLLNARTGLHELVRIVIQQVHEQMDGSGFPRGIPGHIINVMARLINIVDAFLTLIAAGSSAPGIVPADAMAYLVYHTSRGAFDRDAMMAFINVQSMYGLGSLVELDDGRSATIVGSIPSNPLRPIISITATADSAAEIIELHQTEWNIIGPLIDERAPSRKRICKSQLQSILWQIQHPYRPAAEREVVALSD